MNLRLIRSEIMLVSNFINISIIIGISLFAIMVQLFQHELPCPLCILQRIGILGIGFSYLLNIIFGNKVIHYAYSTLAAIFISFIAIRQILLHIVPGSGFYGEDIFGLHMYSWVFIFCILIIIWNMFILTLYPDEEHHEHLLKQIKISNNKIVKYIMVLFIFTVLLNLILTFLQCGITQCPDNPTTYIHNIFKF